MTRSIDSSSACGGDQPAVVARGQQRGLVDHVGEVGAGEAGRAAGDDAEVDVRGERLALGVHLEHGLAADDVRRADGDLAVEAARAQQRRVEDVGPVGRRDQDHAALDVEAVHLDEHLVQRLLALVVAAAHAGAAVPADGVDLVDEDDRRRVGLGLLEQVAHAGGADTDEHLDEVRAGDRVERHAGLAGDGAGEQRLAGAGRPVEQHALGDLGADRLELGGIREELLDLLSSSIASSAPATSANVVFGVSLLTSLALLRPKLITRLPPPCIWLITKNSTPTISRIGSRLTSSDSQVFSLVTLMVKSRCRRSLAACEQR